MPMANKEKSIPKKLKRVYSMFLNDKLALISIIFLVFIFIVLRSEPFLLLQFLALI